MVLWYYTKYSEAWDSGYKAAKNNLGPETNPYKNMELNYWWNDGWEKAVAEKTNFQKEIELERTNCDQQVRVWESKLKEATEQLKYWQLQQEALRVLATRLMLDGFKK